MKTYELPIKIDESDGMIFANGVRVKDEDVCEILTEYITIKLKQDECGKMGHKEFAEEWTGGCLGNGYYDYVNFSHCPKCGADLSKSASDTKGANT